MIKKIEKVLTYLMLSASLSRNCTHLEITFGTGWPLDLRLFHLNLIKSQFYL